MSIPPVSPPPTAGDSELPVRRVQPKIWHLLWAAATRARNRWLLILASLAALCIVRAGFPWEALALASSSLTIYGALVFRDLFDPKIIRRVHGFSETELELCEAADEALRHPLKLGPALDIVERGEHYELFQAIVDAHEAIRIRLSGASTMVRTTLLDAYRRCTDMTRAAEPLVVRGQTLRRYLKRYRPESLQNEIRALEESAAECRDKRAKAAFAAAVRAKENHLAMYGEVQNLCDRVRAQLAFIKVSLQSVEAQLVSLMARDACMEESPPATLEELSDSLRLEIASLDASVESASLDVGCDERCF